MENNELLEIIRQTYQQAYQQAYEVYQEQIKVREENYQSQITSKEQDIENLKEQIKELKDNIKYLKELIIINKQENMIQYNQYNIQSPGGNMSNTSDASSGDKINYNFQNSTIAGGFAGRDYTGDVIHNYSSSELNDTVKKIQELIDTLSQNSSINSTSEQMKIATQVIERIENTPNWKQKAINAAKQGLLEAIKSNPIGAFVAGAIEGW